MSEQAPEQTNLVYRKDYQPPDHVIPHYDMVVQLDDHKTIVTTSFTISPRADETADKSVILDGEQIDLHSIKVNGKILNAADYQRDDKKIVLAPISGPTTIELVQSINPADNTDLQGLYKSGDIYCTQCEPESFRRITYSIDRPDNMATFTTRIEGPASMPTLLGNGDLVDAGTLDDGRHFAKWHDWRPKPSYLFALVGGKLDVLEDTWKTASGRDVALSIHVDPGKAGQAMHAMDSLKRSMAWDESSFSREYPYNEFKIVAVEAFNFGAMENNTLNIFNSKYVLAAPETATDTDYRATEQTVSHEFFHDSTGNTITCRDWFALTLKEGLTRLRDQLFTEDEHDADVRRISEVRYLRLFQFPEDNGPFAHPIQPDQYVTVENFYTPTVYEKGAEVIRMMRTTVGTENFRKGFELYFDRHSGQAVDCEDFIKAIEDGSNTDLSQFRNWYRQAGTPNLSADVHYDPETQSLSIDFTQNTPPTPGQDQKLPVPVPVKMGLIYADPETGNAKSWSFNAPDHSNTQTTEAVFVITEASQKIVFENIPPEIGATMTPSLLRGFSAPVKLTTNLTEQQIDFLADHDTDGFNRWEANQTRLRHFIEQDVNAIVSGTERPDSAKLVQNIGTTLRDPSLSNEYKTLLMALPDETTIGQWFKPIDPLAIHQSRADLVRNIGTTLADDWKKTCEALAPTEPYAPTDNQMARRGLRNQALNYWAASGDQAAYDTALKQALHSDNLTDRLAGTSVLVNHENATRKDTALTAFYTAANGNNLVVDQWFAVQATSSAPDTLQHVESLQAHPDFTIKNPNRAKSLLAQFANLNPAQFHDLSGRGYQMLGDALGSIDAINPQLASVLSRPLRGWQDYAEPHRSMMATTLQGLAEKPDLSPNMKEVVSKCLEGTEFAPFGASNDNKPDHDIGHLLCKPVKAWIAGRVEQVKKTLRM